MVEGFTSLETWQVIVELVKTTIYVSGCVPSGSFILMDLVVL